MGKLGTMSGLLLCVLVSSVGVVAAGPLDDGKAAYKSGDYATALKLVLPLAEQGNPMAQYLLGTMYAWGRGVPKDYKQTLVWYRKSAELGLPMAQDTLGTMLANGAGTAKDKKQAVKWFKLAAAQGYAKAQDDLGTMYENGDGIAKDRAEGIKWHRLAAAQGFAPAQGNLSFALRDDIMHSEMWAILGAEQKDEMSQSVLQINEALMSAVQLAKAKEMAAACKASNYKQCE
jgi:TPR repeat protein